MVRCRRTETQRMSTPGGRRSLGQDPKTERKKKRDVRKVRRLSFFLDSCAPVAAVCTLPAGGGAGLFKRRKKEEDRRTKGRLGSAEGKKRRQHTK